jgi:hypothetical protein
VLILLGALFLVAQFVPGWQRWLDWPLIVIGVGAFLLIFGLLAGAPGMAVPACIVGGIGGLLYWQNATGNWESWAYAWTLIPGFVGVGAILAAALGEGGREQVNGGLWLVFISLVLFTVFGSFFGALGFLGGYWPALLILLGLLILVRNLFRRR